MIGGAGEKKTLRMVAQYAQACNLWGGPELERKLDILRGHCEALGRDYDEIQKTVMFPLDPGKDGENVDSMLEQLQGLAALGISHAHGRVANVSEITPLEILGGDAPDVKGKDPITRRTMAPAAIDDRMELTRQPRLENPDFLILIFLTLIFISDAKSLRMPIYCQP